MRRRQQSCRYATNELKKLSRTNDLDCGRSLARELRGLALVVQVKAGKGPWCKSAGRIAMAACTRVQKIVIQELDLRANSTGRLEEREADITILCALRASQSIMDRVVLVVISSTAWRHRKDSSFRNGVGRVVERELRLKWDDALKVYREDTL